MSAADRLELTCPHCANKCTLGRDDYRMNIGRTIQCPHCQGQMQIADFPGLYPSQQPARSAFDFTENEQTVALSTAKAKAKTGIASRAAMKWMMVAATVLWIIAIPVVLTVFFSAGVPNSKEYKRVGNTNQYLRISDGKLVDGDAMMGTAAAGGMLCGFACPTSLYAVAMVFLGVLYFATGK